MIRCHEPASYGRCAPRLRDQCSTAWHMQVTPLCPLTPSGTQREAVEHALRVFVNDSTWTAGACGINNTDAHALAMWALKEAT